MKINRRKFLKGLGLLSISSFAPSTANSGLPSNDSKNHDFDPEGYIVSTKIIGVGGAGIEILDEMQRLRNLGTITGVESPIMSNSFTKVDHAIVGEDKYCLRDSSINNKFLIESPGEATSDLESIILPYTVNGESSRHHNDIRSFLKGADLVFVIGEVCGDYGPAYAPQISSIAKSMDALTLLVCTNTSFELVDFVSDIKDCDFSELCKHSDSFIFPTSRGDNYISDFITFGIPLLTDNDTAYSPARWSIRSIMLVSDIALRSGGYVGVDFDDLKTVMNVKGQSVMTMGYGQGKDRAAMAVEHATKYFLDDIKRAKSILIHVTGVSDLSLNELDEIASRIEGMSSENACIVFQGYPKTRGFEHGILELGLFVNGLEI